MHTQHQKSSEIQTAFEQIGPVCLKNLDGRHSVLWHAPEGSSANYGVFDRKSYATPIMAISEPNVPIEFYDHFDQVVAGGWRLD